MALNAAFQGWKSVASPLKMSGWHFGKFCLARLATICWFVDVKVSMSWLPVTSLIGVEAMTGLRCEPSSIWGRAALGNCEKMAFCFAWLCGWTSGVLCAGSASGLGIVCTQSRIRSSKKPILGMPGGSQVSPISSSVIACSMALTFASAIATLLFAVRTAKSFSCCALSCSNSASPLSALKFLFCDFSLEFCAFACRGSFCDRFNSSRARWRHAWRGLTCRCVMNNES